MRDPVRGIDKIIAEAQQEGKFDDLIGKGRPLVIDTSPDAVVKSILKEANVDMTPEWIRLAIEIDQLIEQVDRVVETYAAEHAAEHAALMDREAAETPRVPPRQVEHPPRRNNGGCGGTLLDSVEHPPRRNDGACRGTLLDQADRRHESAWRRGWRAFLNWFVGSSAAAPARGSTHQQTVSAFHRRWEDALAGTAGLLHECNRKIRRFNQIVPLANRQRVLLPVAERLDAFVDRFPRLARSKDGALHPVRGAVPLSLLTPPRGEEETAPRQRDVLQVAALQQKLRSARRTPPIG